ncbi:glycosyltransferase [Candidatus Methylocalor cossyra]|uniref:Glycosyltransferase involved in cell wall bisynthesis n=1 Tax=Candidatus Methylocalor cossyra TaxID=3108543 RepID=A0ABM9NF10_9GAMM
MSAPPRLAVLVSFSGSGGVERMILNLLPAFLREGIGVDLLAIIRKPTPDLVRIEGSGLRLFDLGVTHTSLALPALVHYLKTERPAALLAAKDRAIRLAVLARRLSGVAVPLVGRLGTNLSAALRHKPVPLRWLRTLPMRWFYPQVDRVIAVSAGVADDTRRLTGLPAARVEVVRNPVITPELYRKSQAPVDHPWFLRADRPIILGAGRLTQQKDFTTLIRAFAQVRARRDCRLMILGEGQLRGRLERLVAELNLREAVALPGHVANPFAYLAKATQFVLSSRWEGSCNVLTEAMALGIPVVATDCPSGSAELLGGGRYGPLVPVGDVDALAAAMVQLLDHPTEASQLKAAVAEYTAERSARRYLEILGLAPEPAAPGRTATPSGAP